jgi:hypothetical protein
LINTYLFDSACFSFSNDFKNIFISMYYLYRRIHCDSSEYTNQVPWLDHAHHLPPLVPFCLLKTITTGFIVLVHINV